MPPKEIRDTSTEPSRASRPLQRVLPVAAAVLTVAFGLAVASGVGAASTAVPAATGGTAGSLPCQKSLGGGPAVGTGPGAAPGVFHSGVASAPESCGKGGGGNCMSLHGFDEGYTNGPIDTGMRYVDALFGGVDDDVDNIVFCPTDSTMGTGNDATGAPGP